jgi:ferredoxin
MASEKAYQITLRSNGRTYRFPCPASEFILQAALDHGIDLPFMCLQGWCVTCAGRILSGTVDQSASLRFFEADSRAGFVLLCTARPTSDLEIETHQKDAMREHRIRNTLPVPMG